MQEENREDRLVTFLSNIAEHSSYQGIHVRVRWNLGSHSRFLAHGLRGLYYARNKAYSRQKMLVQEQADREIESGSTLKDDQHEYKVIEGKNMMHVEKEVLKSTDCAAKAYHM
jgi:hypothetical protein